MSCPVTRTRVPAFLTLPSRIKLTPRCFDVLEASFAHIFKGEVETFTDMIAHRLRNGNATDGRNALEPSRQVDAIAEDVAFLDNNVAEVNSDAEFDACVRGTGVACPHGRLNVDRTSDGAHDAGKFNQHSIAGKFEDASIVLADFRVDQIFPQ